MTIFGLGIIIFGLILMFVPGIPFELQTLGLALIPSGIITAITEFYLHRDFIQEFRQTRHKSEVIDLLEKLGIENIYEDRKGNDPIFEYIASIANTTPRKLKKFS